MKTMYGVAVAAALVCAAEAQANFTFGFAAVSNNRSADVQMGQSQLLLTITQGANNTVNFRFSNTGPNQMTIGRIFFDDRRPSLDHDEDEANITYSNSGIGFQGEDGGNLPAGNTLDPDFNTSFAFYADNPRPNYGVNRGEWAQFNIALRAGRTLQSVLADMASGALRVGIHVQNFASGGSESFIAGGTPAVIPLPPAAGMGLAGLVGLAIVRRRLARA